MHFFTPAEQLQDVNVHIRSGQTVGVLGGTGSGKTSLVSLIPRLYEAQEGTVSVGGRPVADYTMEHLRDAVSVVLQKNTLFSGTIRENLLWGDPHASEEQLWAACRAACADEFLERMPEGLDTDLDSVTRYLAVISVDAEIEKLNKATATAVAVAENLDTKTEAELNAAFDAVRNANEELRKASLRAAAELNK